MFEFEGNDVIGQVQVAHHADERGYRANAAVPVDECRMLLAEIEIVSPDLDENPGGLAAHLATGDRSENRHFRRIDQRAVRLHHFVVQRDAQRSGASKLFLPDAPARSQVRDQICHRDDVCRKIQRFAGLAKALT